MGLALPSVKSFLPRKDGKSKDAGGGAAAVLTPPAKNGVASGLPFQISATPPQPLTSPVLPSVQGAVPAGPATGLAALMGAAAAPSAAAAAPAAGSPPGEEKSKVGKDVLDLFKQEEAEATPFMSLVGSLPEVDCSALYKECLEMKQMLGGRC